MSNFKYIQKDGKVFMILGNNRMKIRWFKRWVPKAVALDILPSSVTLSKSSYTIKVEGTYTLSATVAPKDASVKTVKWSSSDEKVATVNSAGKITGIKVGTCKIIATCDGDSSVKAECAITVEAKE